MKRLVIPGLIFGVLLAACASAIKDGPTPTPAPLPTATLVPTPVSMFAYDASIPFDTQVKSETEQEGVTVVDLSYAAHAATFETTLGGRTVAYLVKPQGQGPFAGILYLHAFTTANRSRTQFLDEAVRMAQRGAVCLLVQGYFPWMSAQKGSEEDRPQIIGQVTELRRAIDFLLAQPGVDPARLGFVGQDYGAIYGGTLSGADDRLATYVLVGGPGSYANEVELGFSAAIFHNEDYLPIIQDLEPVEYVAKATPASIFFQFGERDRFITKDQGTEYYEAASEPKKMTWYDDLHSMSTEAVLQDRAAWLAEKLSIP